MKKSIALLFTVFLSLHSIATAQTNEKLQRDRDIKIAEGIIANIFGSDVPAFKSQHIHGEYVPGYGVHFTISPRLSHIVNLRRTGSDDENIVVEINQSGSSSSESDREDNIKEKIYEYMRIYAPLISGVPENESIRITYAMNNNRGQSVWGFLENGTRDTQTDPGISVWASVSDLKQFKKGRISEQELMDRMNTYTLSGDEKHTDFDVFSSILETALNNAGTQHLSEIRRPQMEYLPGLGVRYRVQVSTRPSFLLHELNFLDDDFEFKLDSLRMNLEESFELLDESLSPLNEKFDSMFSPDLSEEERQEIREDIQKQRRAVHERQAVLRRDAVQSQAGRQAPSSDSLDFEQEADAIMDELFNVIENYGSTLTSLENDEMLMISVNWSGRIDDLPERTEVRIRKSDLLNGEAPDIEEIERR